MIVEDELDFEISEFYRFWIFEKVEKLMKILEKHFVEHFQDL